MEENKQQEAPKSSGSNQKGIKSSIDQFAAFLNEYMVKKAPFALPMGAKEFIVKVAPYLVIISAVLCIPIILAAIGLSAFLTPFAMMGGYGYMYGSGWGFSVIISLAVAVISLILEIIAVPGLFKRTKKAWRLVFYASIVSFIGGILSISGIVSAIIGAIIGWYILFQVRELYKK
jgi:hypothetical protein